VAPPPQPAIAALNAKAAVESENSRTVGAIRENLGAGTLGK
jgi:hypothetical protein